MSGATLTVTNDNWLTANSNINMVGNGLATGDLTWTNWNGPSAGYTTNAYNLTTALTMK